jgi:PTS system nitrogen regulatory IIA component
MKLSNYLRLIDMDLKIKDVAELLNVSQTTIRRWLAENKIPAYRIREQYRFSREEIQRWVVNKGQEDDLTPAFDTSDGEMEKNARVAVGGSRQFSLYRALHKGCVLPIVAGQRKEEVICSAMEQVSDLLGLDAEGITSLLLDREQLQSTALNCGIAVPHTRDFLLNRNYDIIVVAYPEEPIPFDALDGKPVHTLFFLFASDDKRHLHLLAKIAHLASQPAFLKLLQQRPSKEELLNLIREWESNILLYADN